MPGSPSRIWRRSGPVVHWSAAGLARPLGPHTRSDHPRAWRLLIEPQPDASPRESDAHTVETGWPGKTENPGKSDSTGREAASVPTSHIQ